MDLSSVASAIPPLSSQPTTKLHFPTPSTRDPPTGLPECFNLITRRYSSDLPHHRRQRATLEAVVASLPSSALFLTGSSAATAYLAALISALNRFVSTTDPVVLPDSRAQNALSDSRLSKKEVRKQRLELRKQQEKVDDMSVRPLVAPETVCGPIGDAMIDIPGSAIDNAKKSPSSVDTVASFVSLIALAVHGCSHAVVNLKVGPILESVLAAYSHTSGYVTVAHHANGVFTAVLSVLTASAWSTPQAQTAFQCLMRHNFDNDESFRLNSRKALSGLLHCPQGAVVAACTSPLSATLLKSTLQHRFSLTVRDNLSDSQRVGALDGLLHLIATIECCVGSLLPPDAAHVASELLSIAIKDLPNISSAAYSALSTIFSVRSNNVPGTESLRSLLSQDDLLKLVFIVVNHSLPEDCFDEVVVAYATCVASGASAYAACHEHISPSDDLIFRSARRLFEAVDPSHGKSLTTKSICWAFQMLLDNKWFKSKPFVLTLLHSFVKVKYSLVWSNVIPILCKYLESGMCAGHEQMKDSVKLLISNVVEMREVAERSKDRKQVEVAESVLKSISRGGAASLILDRCQIGYDEKDHVTNGWILTVLRGNISGAPLFYFTKQLAPIAQRLDAVMLQRLSEKRVIEAKNIAIHRTQIWALLPGFCTKPLDLLHEGVLTMAFQAIHACFTSKDMTNIFPIAVAALRQLSNSLLTLPVADPTCREKIEMFSILLKKLFPTMASAVSQSSDDKRASLLDAVSTSCRATNDPSLVSALLRKCIRQLLELQLKLSSDGKVVNDNSGSDGDIDLTSESRGNIRKQQHSTADLSIAIVESRIVPDDATEIGYLEKAISPFLFDCTEPSLQKKAYRVSAMMVTAGVITKDNGKFMEFVKNTSEAHFALATGSKAARLGWITAIINRHIQFPVKQKEQYLNELSSYFLPEIILSTRDSSEKSRCAAFDTLVNLARAWYSLNEESDASFFQKFLLSICAGLGGKSSPMLAGTLNSIGQLLKTFRHEIAAKQDLHVFVDSLFSVNVKSDQGIASTNDESNKTCVEPGPIAILMRHESVEVQRAAVATIKVATKCCSKPDGRLLNIVPGILPGLLHVAAGSKKRETRLRVRVILERLIRKCGLEEIDALFPQEHKKLLTAVRKQYIREVSKKVAKKEESLNKKDYNNGGNASNLYEAEYNSDESDVESEPLQGITGAGGVDSNDGDDTGKLVNLLEAKSGLIPSLRLRSQKALTSSKTNRIDKIDVKYSEDGKPIFVESDDDSGGAVAGSLDGGASSDENADIAFRGSGGKITGKRRLDDSDGTQRPVKKLKGSFGEEYRGKRGGGDVKRANRPDPYAYVPLDRSMFSAGSRIGTGGKRNRGSALHLLASKSLAACNKKRGGKLRVPGKR